MDYLTLSQYEIPFKFVCMINDAEERCGHYHGSSCATGYYCYLDTIGGELALVTAAARFHKRKCKEYVKAVVVHTIGGQAYMRNMYFTGMGGYHMDWQPEGFGKRRVYSWYYTYDCTASHTWREVDFKNYRVAQSMPLNIEALNQTKYKYCAFNGSTFLLDYLKLYPHDFKYWHDMRIDQWSSKRDDALNEKLLAVAKKYAGLEYKRDGFVVLIAQKKIDIIHEGNALHHCVGRMNYDVRMTDERSLIFFIRSAEAPDVPLTTVELGLVDGIRVVQAYGDHDAKPPQEVSDFIAKWEAYAKRKAGKILSAKTSDMKQSKTA